MVIIVQVKTFLYTKDIYQFATLPLHPNFQKMLDDNFTPEFQEKIEKFLAEYIGENSVSHARLEIYGFIIDSKRDILKELRA